MGQAFALTEEQLAELVKLGGMNVHTYLEKQLPGYDNVSVLPGAIYYRGAFSMELACLEWGELRLRHFYQVVHANGLSQTYVLRNMETGQSITAYSSDDLLMRPSQCKDIHIKRELLHKHNLTLFKNGGAI